MRVFYWPSLAASLIVGIYWGRVIQMAIRARFKYGRPAQFVPREPLGKALRLIWFPIIFFWFCAPLWVFLGARFRPLYNNPAAWIGVAVAAVALWGTFVCWKRMGRDWRMGIDPAEKNRLIVAGPFGYVRHPIYALSQMMMIGTVIATPTVVMIVVAAAHVLLLQWEARREEAHLLSIHGEEYARYLQGVGRFLPRSFRAYSPANPAGA